MALAFDPRFVVVDVAPHPRAVDPGRVYRRRRIGALLMALTIVLGGVAAGRALAGRGDAPASVPAAQPVQLEPYVVQPGDTLWVLAQRFRGDQGLTSYLDDLVRANGGPDIEVGQRLRLP